MLVLVAELVFYWYGDNRGKPRTTVMRDAATVTEHLPFEGLLFSRGPRAPGRPRPRSHTPSTGRSYPDTMSRSTLPSLVARFALKYLQHFKNDQRDFCFHPPTRQMCVRRLKSSPQHFHFSTRPFATSPPVAGSLLRRAAAPAQRRRCAGLRSQSRSRSRSGERDRRRASGERERERR